MRAERSLTAEEGPGEGRAGDGGTLGDDGAVADGTASSAQSVTKDSQEDDWSNDTLEGEEVLDLGVRNAQEGQLEQEVEHEAAHACGRDAFVFGNVIGDVCKAGPDGCEQDGHALTSGGGLHTEPDNGENTARQDNKVTEEVAEWHTCKHRERSVKGSTHSAVDGDDETHDGVSEHTGSNGHSPAETDCNHGRSCTRRSAPSRYLAVADEAVGVNSPTSQLDTAQASAIQ
jgi:hypothetical protein